MNIHFSSASSEWETPRALFDELDAVYHFTLDPCATPENAKCAKFYTKADDGLAQSWAGERVFMNPPYGREISKWVQKAATVNAELVVGLLPARTDTRWFHEHIAGQAGVRFIRGRLKFSDAKNSAPFPSMIVLWVSNAA